MILLQHHHQSPSWDTHSTLHLRFQQLLEDARPAQFHSVGTTSLRLQHFLHVRFQLLPRSLLLCSRFGPALLERVAYQKWALLQQVQNTLACQGEMSAFLPHVQQVAKSLISRSLQDTTGAMSRVTSDSCGKLERPAMNDPKVLSEQLEPLGVWKLQEKVCCVTAGCSVGVLTVQHLLPGSMKAGRACKAKTGEDSDCQRSSLHISRISTHNCCREAPCCYIAGCAAIGTAGQDRRIFREVLQSLPTPRKRLNLKARSLQSLASAKLAV